MSYVYLRDLATELRIDPSSLRKSAIKAGIPLLRLPHPDARGQNVLAMAAEDADRIRAAREPGVRSDQLTGPTLDLGSFYAIQVVPDFAPHRIKFGFASHLDFRLAEHRTAAPTAVVLKAWPSRRSWEQAAIASVTRVGCTLLGGEVFDCDDADSVIRRGDEFFAILPPP